MYIHFNYQFFLYNAHCDMIIMKYYKIEYNGKVFEGICFFAVKLKSKLLINYFSKKIALLPSPCSIIAIK